MVAQSYFGKRMAVRAENVRQNMEQMRRQAAEEILIEVVLATPVDTGKARSNWRVGNGSPASGTVPPHSPGRRLGIGESANADATIATGQSAIQDSNPNLPIYITNNVGYIADLNDGGSTQAGPRFVERAFERARVRVYRSRRLLDSPGSR